MNFFGAGIYEYKGKLLFIGGKYGKGENKSDYKTEIYAFNPKENKFTDFHFFVEKKKIL